MNYTYFIILCLVAANNVTAKSFTIVLDTTESMKEEINIIKANIASVIDVNNDRDIENYNIVPFNDPDVGPVISSFNSREFTESFSYIKTSGGEDCPENSLAGINTALEISSPLSYIFVFTDAFAKDYANVSAIMHLCSQKQSKVNIFLSGVCLTTRFNRKGDINVYYEIAKACSGVVFQFDFYNLRQAFRYIKEIINTEWSDVTDYRSYDTISLPVNEYVQEMMIAVSSLKPLPDFNIVSASGQKPAIEKVVDARKTQVLKINYPETGSYSFNVRSENILYVAAFVRSQVAFEYGFSTASPSNLLETTDKPIPGRVNYILIHTQTKITKVEMYTPSKKMITILEIEEITPGIHISRVYIESNQVIKIYVTFDNTDKQSKIPSATNFLCPQKTVYNASPQKPYIKKIEMENNIVDYGSEVRIATKVIGYPKPTIYWEDNNGDKLQSEDSILELPITYVSYVRIKNVRTNMTIYCKAQNSEGESTESYELYVKRPYSFEVIKTPEDTWIEYGSEGKLYCQVDAFPEARIQWYHNDSLITDTDNIKWIPDDNVLVINNMSLDDSGHYKCEMTNDIDTKSFSAQISISGIEAPKVELAKTEVTLMLDDSTEIECRILQGKPAPTVTWWYKSDINYDYDYIPSGVTSDNEKLKITSSNMEHKGTYKCVATNIIGSDSSEVTLKIEFTPIIKDSEETTMVVTEGDPVEMSCDVTASPKAIVRWEMSQDDLIIRFDERHTTDDRHVHRFNALWKDSGNYHCIAENTIGKAEKTIILNVLVAPYIEAPKNKYISGRIGDEIMLPCNVLYGNPAPSIKWEFIAADSPVVTLKRGNSTNTLHIMKLTRSNEGTYMCVAENRAGIDSIKYHVKVQ